MRALFSWRLPTRDPGSASREESQQRGWKAEIPQILGGLESGRLKKAVDCALVTRRGAKRRWEGRTMGEEAESQGPCSRTLREQSTDPLFTPQLPAHPSNNHQAISGGNSWVLKRHRHKLPRLGQLPGPSLNLLRAPSTTLRQPDSLSLSVSERQPVRGLFSPWSPKLGLQRLSPDTLPPLSTPCPMSNYPDPVSHSSFSKGSQLIALPPQEPGPRPLFPHSSAGCRGSTSNFAH